MTPATPVASSQMEQLLMKRGRREPGLATIVLDYAESELLPEPPVVVPDGVALGAELSRESILVPHWSHGPLRLAPVAVRWVGCGAGVYTISTQIGEETTLLEPGRQSKGRCAAETSRSSSRSD